MNLTVLLAQILGLYMLLSGLSALLYPDRARKALHEARKSYLLPYFDGAIAFIFGLLIVLNHNIWNGLAASLITLIGWIAVLEGVFMLLLPQDSISGALKKLDGKGTIVTWSIVSIVVGLYLAYVGFFA